MKHMRIGLVSMKCMGQQKIIQVSNILKRFGNYRINLEYVMPKDRNSSKVLHKSRQSGMENGVMFKENQEYIQKLIEY